MKDNILEKDFFEVAKKVGLVKNGKYIDGIPKGEEEDVNLFYRLEDQLGYPQPTTMKDNIDYFEEYHLLPQDVQDLVIEFGMTNEFTYEACRELIKKLNNLGWTCDYDLSGEPFDLKPLEK